MKIYVKDDCNDYETFEDIAYRIGLFNVFSNQDKNTLAIYDEYYIVNDGSTDFERSRLYRTRQLIDLINICATLEIKLLITNSNIMSKELFFEMRRSQVYNDAHEFETGLSVPAWVAEGFDSRHAWEEDNQHDADADTSNDLDETNKYFNL